MGKWEWKSTEGFLSAFFLLPSTASLSRLSSYFKKHERKTHQTKRLLRRLNLVSVVGKRSSSIDDGNKNVVIKKTSLFFQTLLQLFRLTENVKCRWIFLALNSWRPKPCLEGESSRAVTVKKCTEKVCCTREVVVFLVESITFSTFSWRRCCHC